MNIYRAIYLAALITCFPLSFFIVIQTFLYSFSIRFLIPLLVYTPLFPGNTMFLIPLLVYCIVNPQNCEKYVGISHLQKLRKYLLGNSFTLYTDSNAIK